MSKSETDDSARKNAIRSLVLNDNDAHVWQIDLTDRDRHASAQRAYLSDDELKRAARFRFPSLSNRFIVARASIREILSRYLDLVPQSIRFVYDTFGKPEIAHEQNPRRLRFNVSHSENFALCAIAWQSDIGVDVEYVKPLSDLTEVARRFFASEEQAALAALPSKKQLEGFYKIWTRKEAYLKAIGKGLSEPLDQFVVTLEDSFRMKSVDGKVFPRWTSLSLKLEDTNYIGALAVDAFDVNLFMWRFLSPSN
jgi:4'-phosphopantetheinyl transferase